MRTSVGSLSTLFLAAVLWVGCGSKVIRETVFENEQVNVQLRRTMDGDDPVPLGYDHPATIADVRLAHIVASLQFKTFEEGSTAGPLIRTEQIYDLAEGIAQALAKATPDDVVVAWTFSFDRKMVVFSDARSTSMQVFVRDGQLFFHFYDIEMPIDAEQRRKGWEPPLEVSTGRPAFELEADKAQLVVGPRLVAVDWRDAYYRQPHALRSVHGRLSRRTVIMRDESLDGEIDEAIEEQIERELDAEEDPSTLPIPTAVTDAQIRALDELDGARRSGLVTEGEFQRRRRLVLQGRLTEAGYAVDPE